MLSVYLFYLAGFIKLPKTEVLFSIESHTFVGEGLMGRDSCIRKKVDM